MDNIKVGYIGGVRSGKSSLAEKKILSLCKGAQNPLCPMSAMALFVGVALGGGGYYNNKFKEKGLLGAGGRCKLQKSDVEQALSLGKRLDILLLGLLILWII